MAASVIAISSNSLEESMGTSTAQIILFGMIPTAILTTVLVVDPPVISTLPYTSPFLYTDSSDNSLLGYPSDTSSGNFIQDSPFDTSAATPVRPSRKRCRSSTTLAPIAIPVSRVLSPVHANLLPPCKRIRGFISTILRQADIDAGIAAANAATAKEMDVRVEVRIETKAEAGKEANAEIQPEGTIKIRVDIATEIDFHMTRLCQTLLSD
nr:hypothetical protein [Tanacetum cinerariifolium]